MYPIRIISPLSNNLTSNPSSQSDQIVAEMTLYPDLEDAFPREGVVAVAEIPLSPVLRTGSLALCLSAIINPACNIALCGGEVIIRKV